LPCVLSCRAMDIDKVTIRYQQLKYSYVILLAIQQDPCGILPQDHPPWI
jgi:hypothetical protein